MKRVTVVAAVALAQLALVGVGVAPQLSARVTGETYRFAVQPVDPVNPFRGAYVDLDYPDLDLPSGSSLDAGEDVHLTLTERDGLMVSTGWSTRRPTSGPYLTCTGRWPVRCGIESWFADQGEARRLEQELMDGGAIAEVRIDARGNAAIVGLEPR